MSKTNEEPNELKKEVESVNEKCRELTPEELEQVCGGAEIPIFEIQCPVNESRSLLNPRLQEILDELLKNQGE